MPSTRRYPHGSGQTVNLSWRASTQPGVSRAGLLPAATKSDAILILFLHLKQLMRRDTSELQPCSACLSVACYMLHCCEQYNDTSSYPHQGKYLHGRCEHPRVVSAATAFLARHV